MATVKELNLEDESQNKASSSEQLSSASTISPQTGAATGATGANMSPTQTDSRRGSGRFMNLQKYLDANQGAGEQLAGGITKATQQESDQFQKQAQQKSNPISQNIQAEKDRLAQATQMNQQVQKGQAQQVAQNNLDDFTKVRMGQNNLADIRGLKDQYSQFAQQGLRPLGQTAEQAATEGGRFNLLRDTYGGNRPGSEYGLGQRRLDQLFLQAEGGGQLNQLQQSLQNQVGQARDQFEQQMDQFGQSVQGIDEGTRQAQEEAMAALGQWGQPGQGAFGSLYGQLQEGIQGRQSEINNAVKRAQQQLARGRIDQSLAQELGLSGSLNTFDLNLQDWAKKIRAGDDNVTMAEVAQEDQLGQLAALQQLAGIDPSEHYLGEKEGRLLDNRFSSELISAARQAEKDYINNFFDRLRYDEAKRQGILHDPNAIKDPQSRERYQRHLEYLKNHNIEDHIRVLLSGPVRSGIFFTGGHYADLRQDNTRSISQLEAIRDRAREKNAATPEHARSGLRFGRTAKAMQAYIDEINRISRNRLNVTPNTTGPQDQMLGGRNFNVMRD